MSTIHLLVLVHGMWGSPVHLAELDRIIREKADSPAEDGTLLHAMLATTNSEDRTYDGLDWGAERVVKEIYEAIETLEKEGNTVTKFSITGYSLGGLISRYVVGILKQRGFFDTVKPVNFNTLATPHIGLLRSHIVFGALASTLGPKLLSRTGKQFYLKDDWNNSGRPLLDIMADPGMIFYQGLALFEHIRIYANGVKDSTVPYVTGAIEETDPFTDFEHSGIEIQFDKKYDPIIKSYSLPLVPPPPTPKPRFLSRKWIRENKNKNFLPPFLQFSFPMNIVFYVLLPLLIPGVLTMIVVRLSLASRSSRARIKLLESDESNGQRLANSLANLEKQMEDAVAELVDDPGPVQESDKQHSNQSRSQPLLIPLQHKIIFNSHAVIISRDVKRFEWHRKGEGVIRHWADSFIL
ncbi:DUF676-domain-containing protein [Mycena floridula]|nr:DUF676-domain-containing protein [Mycena floridula]